MSRTPTTVVFDLGGVLMDYNPRYLYRDLFAGDEAAMEHFLATVCTHDWNVRQDAGRSIAEAEAELLAVHPQHEPLIRAFYGQFDRMIPRAIEGTVAVLEALDAAGVPLYALTNFGAETFRRTRPRFPFLERFRGIVVSGEIKLIKPDPAIYRHLLDRHRLAAADCVFIDDAPRNAAGARGVGMHAIEFRSPEQLAAELAALGFSLPAR